MYVGSKGSADNVVIIDSGLDKGVIGGFAENSAAENNSVSISGKVNGDVYGGCSYDGNAIENSVSISGSNTVVTGDVYGGSASDIAKENKVNISGGTVRDVYGGLSSSGNATGNSVNISGGTVTGWVYGGYAPGDNIEATGNSVMISGGEVKGDVAGGCLESRGSTTGNSVTISDGIVQGDIYGGKVFYGDAKDNRVIISGGMVTGNVYGGFSNSGGTTGNSITLSGTADVSEADLYGGRGDVFENNKLIINGWSGTVQSLNDFFGDKGGIEVQALAGGLNLIVGEPTDFVFTEKGINFCDNPIKAENIQAGVALTVSGTIAISNDNKNICINPTSVRASDQTAITTESRAAAAAFVNQGAEVVSDSINSLQGAEAGISTFATVSGNNSKYDTGSYVDINGWNGIVGVAKTKDLNAGKFSYGAFFENGGGNYNTYNDFNGTSFRGDGNVVYNGGGLLMRYEQENGVYTEASLRAGTARSKQCTV